MMARVISGSLLTWHGYVILIKKKIISPAMSGAPSRWIRLLASHQDRKRCEAHPASFGHPITGLNKCLKNITKSIGCYDVMIHTDSNFLQVLLWERFPLLAPQRLKFPLMVMDMVTRVDTLMVKCMWGSYEPRAWDGCRWSSWPLIFDQY